MSRSSGFFFVLCFALVACPYFAGNRATISAQGRPEDPAGPAAQTEQTISLDVTTDLTGSIVAAPGGRPFRNVEVTLLNISSGATLRTHTDAKGQYRFHGIVTGIDYVLTPWRPGYFFTPGALVITPTVTAAAYDFTGAIEPEFFVPSPAF